MLPPVGLKVVGAQLTIRLVPHKHMEGTDDDRVGNGANGPFLAPPGGNPMIQGREVCPFRAGGGMGELRQTGAQGPIAFAGRAGALDACAFIVARGHATPGR